MKALLAAALLAVCGHAWAGALKTIEDNSFYNYATLSTTGTFGSNLTSAALTGYGFDWTFQVSGGSATFTIGASTGTPLLPFTGPPITVTTGEPLYGWFRFYEINPVIKITQLQAGATAMVIIEGGTGKP